MRVRIGTSGWNLPAPLRDRFPADGSRLARYAAVFRCVEITSSFYRPHRRGTYERWAASVPAEFAFAVKLPRTITHERRLVDAAEPLEQFLEETAGLGDKRGVVLVQLPPRFAYDAEVVSSFVSALRARYAGAVAWEPRHPTWFTGEADAVLADAGIARVAADPAVVPAAAEPGGARTFAYVRWHGSPHVYTSSYDEERLAALAARVHAEREAWCIFDNTRLGAATGDALRLAEVVEA